MFSGSLPIRTIFPPPAPNGTTHRWPEAAFQSAVMIGAVVRYQPVFPKL